MHEDVLQDEAVAAGACWVPWRIDGVERDETAESVSKNRFDGGRLRRGICLERSLLLRSSGDGGDGDDGLHVAPPAAAATCA